MKATGLLTYFEKFSSICTLIVLCNTLDYLRPLAAKLQKSDIDIWHAYGMIDEVLLSIENLRKNICDHNNDWWSEINDLCESPPTVPRLTAVQRNRRNVPAFCDLTHCGCASNPCPKMYYIRSIAIPFVDHALTETKERFQERVNVGMCQFIPKLLQKRNFLIEQESLSFWLADLPNPQMLLPKSNRWIRLWKQRINGELPTTLIETLRATDKDCFPNIHTLLMIGCVLRTSSATAERSFSLLRRLRTHLRSTKGDNRLSGLILMSSHYSIPINIDAVANHFAQMHPRRMFMRSAILVTYT